MSFIDDHKVPTLLPYTLTHAFLFGVVDGKYYLRGSLPRVRQLLLVNGGEDDVESFPEPTEHLILPLNSKRRRTENQNTLNSFPQLHLLYQEAGHDGFTCPMVVCQKKTQPGLGKHRLIDGFDLVRQSTDTRETHRELTVVCIGEANPGRLNQETKLISIHWLDQFGDLSFGPKN